MQAAKSPIWKSERPNRRPRCSAVVLIPRSSMAERAGPATTRQGGLLRPRECLFTAQSDPESSLKSFEDEIYLPQHHRRLVACANAPAAPPCLKRMLFVPTASAIARLAVLPCLGERPRSSRTSCCVQLLCAAGIAVRGVIPDAARGCRKSGIETEMEGTFGRVGTAAAAARPEPARSRSGAASGPSYPIWQVGAGVDPPVAGHSRTPSTASRAQSKREEPCLEVHTILRIKIWRSIAINHMDGDGCIPCALWLVPENLKRPH